MAGNTTKTNLMQTSYNVAASVVNALATVGKVEGFEDAVNILNQIQQDVYNDLLAVHETEPAPAPRQSGGNSGGSVSNLDPGTLKLKDKYKKHAGKTIAEVYAVDPSYIEWLANTAKDTFINGRAGAYLKAIGHNGITPESQGANILGQ